MVLLFVDQPAHQHRQRRVEQQQQMERRRRNLRLQHHQPDVFNDAIHRVAQEKALNRRRIAVHGIENRRHIHQEHGEHVVQIRNIPEKHKQRRQDQPNADIKNGQADALLTDIYVDESLLDTQKERYIAAIEKFISLYGDKEVEVFSAPGRSEVSGNHTDHQHGEVLAAAINLDIIAITAPRDGEIKVLSDDYDLKAVALDDLDKKAEEEGLPEIAAILRAIAMAEKMHEERYLKLAKQIEDGTVFKKDHKVLWKCNNCGFVVESLEAPTVCPACNHPQAYFEEYKFFD